MTHALRLAMTPMRTQAGMVYMPRTWGRIVRGTMISRRLRTLVDSGAQLTVAPVAVAHELGLSDADLALLPGCEVGGIGGSVQRCHEARLGLHVGPGKPEAITLSAARVFFVPQLLGDYELVLGQRDALELLSFEQYNQPRVREFMLRAMPPR